jgi:hypothetical protein
LADVADERHGKIEGFPTILQTSSLRDVEEGVKWGRRETRLFGVICDSISSPVIGLQADGPSREFGVALLRVLGLPAFPSRHKTTFE